MSHRVEIINVFSACSTFVVFQYHFSFSVSHVFLEPITTIVGGPDLYINTGSTVNLTCIIRHSPEPPPAIYWTHNNQVSDVVSVGKWVEDSKESTLCKHFFFIFFISR
jgi:hypothetical protein